MDLPDIAGLPLHPLIVHAVVVLLPLTAFAVVLAAIVPAAQRRLGLVTPLAALLVLGLVPFTLLSGEQLKETVGPLPAVEHHEMLGRMLPPWAIGLFLVAAAQWAWSRFRPRAAEAEKRHADTVVSIVLAIVAVAVAVGSTVMVVLIGEAGARSVWG